MDPDRRTERKLDPEFPTPPRTSVASLSDDVLAAILLRLPSPASLARAALVSRRWRRLATSRGFLRRFRALHPAPPLLGCFVGSDSDDAAFHAFHSNTGLRSTRINTFFLPITFLCSTRAQIRSDRDLAAAVRGGDFLLTGLDEARQWHIRDCRHGIILLSSKEQFALLNPVSRQRVIVSRPNHSTRFRDHFSFHTCLLPASGGGDEARSPSFRLVSLEVWPKVRVFEYSSGSGEWRSYPSAPPSIKAPPPRSQRMRQDESSFYTMHAAGRVYWKYKKGEVLLSLDAATGGSMEFSHITLPPVPDLYQPQAPYVVGETEDGACCLVCVVSTHYGCSRALQVWLRNEEAGSWDLEKDVPATLFFGHDRLDLRKVIRVCVVTAGVVLLSLDCGSGRHRYLAFRLTNLYALLGSGDTRKLPFEADFITCRGLVAYPYLLAWSPPSLLQ
ncbi:unnamed protein product [Urochloa humidicola]